MRSKAKCDPILSKNRLGEIIKDRDLQIVSRPEVETAEFDESGAFSFSAIFEVKPEIEVKDYLGLEVEKVKISITDAQVEEALQRLQEGHARLELVEGREVVQKGDFVTLDFEGMMDGKPFAGGKGENYMLEVGSEHALPQFDDAVVGLRLGERQTVAVNYPENYPNKEIAGKAVDFSIVAREIKQKVLPMLDDEFAKDHGECASLEELKSASASAWNDELKQYQDEELKGKAHQPVDRSASIRGSALDGGATDALFNGTLPKSDRRATRRRVAGRRWKKSGKISSRARHVKSRRRCWSKRSRSLKTSRLATKTCKSESTACARGGRARQNCARVLCAGRSARRFARADGV